MTDLGTRLETALDYSDGFDTLLDVGTDHGLLPIKALLTGKVKKAVASDNKERPLANARTNIEKYGLGDRIDVVLTDGIPKANGADLVAILGMGGILIASILENGDLKATKRLILSPNSDQYLVRTWLENHHYAIIAEAFVEDKRKFYQLIVAETGEMQLTEPEREFGPLILKEKPQAFGKYLDREIRKLTDARAKASDPEAKDRLGQRIATLKGLIA